MQDWRKHILFFSIIAMMVSLFLSRTALSVSIIFFLALCLLHTKIPEQLRRFISSPLLWGMSLLFVLPLISGLWSDNKNEWQAILRIKLPLLLLPMAFAFPFTFSKKQWQTLGLIFILIITAGTIWSMFHYVTNISAVNEGYLRAKTLLTPLENDHVRFSWLVTVAILFTGWIWSQRKDEKKRSWLLSLTGAWLIIFLHILAARTGLVCFYIIIVATIGWVILKKTKPWQGAMLLIALAVLPVIAYLLLPTFRNKVKYFRYDLAYFKEAHYLPGGNDASRVISLKAGWGIMAGNPAKGVGFGDISAAKDKWYEKNYPEVKTNDRILPSNEWLIYGDGCGIPGFLIFTGILLIPFFTRVKAKGRWWLLNSIVIISLLPDIGLEVQFGVFIYSFIVLFSWKWLDHIKLFVIK